MTNINRRIKNAYLYLFCKKNPFRKVPSNNLRITIFNYRLTNHLPY